MYLPIRLKNIYLIIFILTCQNSFSQTTQDFSELYENTANLIDQDNYKKAFDQAAGTVAQWESAQGFEPSEPQWVIGKNMELMLPQLEQHLFPQTTPGAQQSPAIPANPAQSGAALN